MRRTLRRPRASAIAALASAVLGAGCASTPRFDGPIAARNQHPAQLVVGRLRPRSAEVVPTGAVRLDWRNAYTSLFLAGDANGDLFEMDGEYLRSAVAARVGLGGGFDAEIEVPVAHASGGFMDDFIIDWHELLGAPDQGRKVATSEGFSVRAEQGGAAVYGVEPHGVHLLDVPVVLSWAPVAIGADRPFGVMLRGGVELPTGDTDAGYGSGRAEWMVGAVVEYRTGPIAWNAHFEHSWAETPSRARAQGFEMADVNSYGFGAEFALADGFALLSQVERDQSTLRQLDLQRASAEQWLLWTAARLRITDTLRVEVGVGEDLSPHVAPDFSAWIALSLDLGR